MKQNRSTIHEIDTVDIKNQSAITLFPGITSLKKGRKNQNRNKKMVNKELATVSLDVATENLQSTSMFENTYASKLQ